MLNRGRAKHPLLMESLQWLFWAVGHARLPYDRAAIYWGFRMQLQIVHHSSCSQAMQLTHLANCLPAPGYEFIPRDVPMLCPVSAAVSTFPFSQRDGRPHQRGHRIRPGRLGSLPSGTRPSPSTPPRPTIPTCAPT